MAGTSTIIVYNLTGGTDYNVPFEYLARSFVKLTLLGVSGRRPLTLNTDFRFVSKTTVSLTIPNPAGYDQLEVRRETSATERLVDFHDGSILRAYDMNLSQIQTLHVAEEARNVASDGMGTNDDGNLDARNRRIVNLADPINPQDAVTLKILSQYDNSTANNAAVAQASAQQAHTYKDQAGTFAQQAYDAQAAAGNHAVYARDRADEAKEAAVAAGVSENNAESAADEASAHADRAEAARDASVGYEDLCKEQVVLAKAEADRAAKEAEKLADFNSLMDMTTVDVDTKVNFYGAGWNVSIGKAVGPMAGEGSLMRMGATGKQDFSMWNRSSDNLMRFGWVDATGGFTTKFYLEDDYFKVNGSIQATRDIDSGANLRGVNVLSTGAGSMYASGTGWVGCYPDSGSRGNVRLIMDDSLGSWHSRTAYETRNGWVTTGARTDSHGSYTDYAISYYNAGVRSGEWKFDVYGNLRLPDRTTGSAFVNQYSFDGGIVQSIQHAARGAYYPMIKQLGYQGGVEAIAWSSGILVNTNGTHEFCIHSCIEGGSRENIWRFNGAGETIFPSSVRAPAVFDSGHRVFSPVNQPTHLPRKDGYAELIRPYFGNFDSGDFNLGDWTRFDIIYIYSSGQNDDHIIIDSFTRQEWEGMERIANAAVSGQGTFNIVTGSGRSWIITSVPWGHYLLQYRGDNCRIRAIELGRYW